MLLTKEKKYDHRSMRFEYPPRYWRDRRILQKKQRQNRFALGHSLQWKEAIATTGEIYFWTIPTTTVSRLIGAAKQREETTACSSLVNFVDINKAKIFLVHHQLHCPNTYFQGCQMLKEERIQLHKDQIQQISLKSIQSKFTKMKLNTAFLCWECRWDGVTAVIEHGDQLLIL